MCIDEPAMPERAKHKASPLKASLPHCGRGCRTPDRSPRRGGGGVCRYRHDNGGIQPASPAKIAFFKIAWTPQLASTTWVTPKSTATDISEIASSSLSPFCRHQEVPHLAEGIAHRTVERG